MPLIWYSMNIISTYIVQWYILYLWSVNVEKFHFESNKLCTQLPSWVRYPKEIYYFFPGAILSIRSWEKRLYAIRIWTGFWHFWINCFFGESNYWRQFKSYGNENDAQCWYWHSGSLVYIIWYFFSHNTSQWARKFQKVQAKKTREIK